MRWYLSTYCTSSARGPFQKFKFPHQWSYDVLGRQRNTTSQSVKVFYLCFISPLDMHPKQSSQACWAGYVLLLQFRAYIPFFIMTASSSRTEPLLRAYIYRHQSARGKSTGIASRVWLLRWWGSINIYHSFYTHPLPIPHLLSKISLFIITKDISVKYHIIWSRTLHCHRPISPSFYFHFAVILVRFVNGSDEPFSEGRFLLRIIRGRVVEPFTFAYCELGGLTAETYMLAHYASRDEQS